MLRKSLANRFILLLLMLIPAITSSSQNTIRIMPVGNSITFGYTDGSLSVDQMRSYRYGLKFLLNSHGYNTDFVGTQSSGCAYFSDCQHAGFGGTQDQYILRLLIDGQITYYTTGWVTEQTIQPPGPYLDVFNPDIILLHIGTNDVTNEGDAALTNQKITAILDKVDEYEARASKEVIVFVALILNRCNYSLQTTTFNNGIKTLVQNRINSGDKLVIVDMEHDAGFVYMDDADMADDLHPNEIGYSKMATLWYSSIEANYNTPPVISEIPDQSFDEGTSSNAILLDSYVADLQDSDENIIWTAEQLGTSSLNIVINSNRQVVATPKNPDWNGSQTVVFKATDLGRKGKYIKFDTDTVIFVVNPVDNAAPVITDIPDQSFDEGTSSNIIELDNYVSDPEDPDENIAWSCEQLETANLDITINSRRQAVATPKDPDWNGSQIVVFTATDMGRHGTDIKFDTDRVVFTVNPVNDPPVITSTPILEVKAESVYTYTLMYTDIDNVSDELSAVIIPAWLTFSQISGLLTGIPEVSNLGQNQVLLRVSDGLSSTDQEFTITVDLPDALVEPDAAGFSIYPVPAKRFLMIESGNLKGENFVEVIALSGAIIKKTSFPPGQTNCILNLDGFENGFYFLRIENKTTTWISKFSVIN
jgi:hypothetical protein